MPYCRPWALGLACVLTLCAQGATHTKSAPRMCNAQSHLGLRGRGAVEAFLEPVIRLRGGSRESGDEKRPPRSPAKSPREKGPSRAGNESPGKHVGGPGKSPGKVLGSESPPKSGSKKRSGSVARGSGKGGRKGDTADEGADSKAGGKNAEASLRKALSKKMGSFRHGDVEDNPKAMRHVTDAFSDVDSEVRGVQYCPFPWAFPSP